MDLYTKLMSMIVESGDITGWRKVKPEYTEEMRAILLLVPCVRPLKEDLIVESGDINAFIYLAPAKDIKLGGLAEVNVKTIRRLLKRLNTIRKEGL